MSSNKLPYPYNTTKNGMTIIQHNPTMAVELNNAHNQYGQLYLYDPTDNKWLFQRKLNELEITQAESQRDKCIILDGATP